MLGRSNTPPFSRVLPPLSPAGPGTLSTSRYPRLLAGRQSTFSSTGMSLATAVAWASLALQMAWVHTAPRRSARRTCRGRARKCTLSCAIAFGVAPPCARRDPSSYSRHTLRQFQRRAPHRCTCPVAPRAHQVAELFWGRLSWVEERGRVVGWEFPPDDTVLGKCAFLLPCPRAVVGIA